ncbi:uncharacterized protein RCO7_11480 [Rhynchosporium graminicola]|uniref:Uncharacterized protein n=1 Tax=Rhynchosporium graminicola TaxID=2792576 RepID=A0A1E1LKY9_9HELO|nr:uncharacterized protein RCO7_11480 [Rhynchosporium commune]
MRSSALLSVMVLGLSALTAALPGLEIRAGNNRVPECVELPLSMLNYQNHL